MLRSLSGQCLSGIQKVKKVICEKVVKPSVKGASVGGGRNGASSSDVMMSASGTQKTRQGVCKVQARPSVQALAAQVVLVQRDRSVERGREREREKERTREG